MYVPNMLSQATCCVLKEQHNQEKDNYMKSMYWWGGWCTMEESVKRFWNKSLLFTKRSSLLSLVSMISLLTNWDRYSVIGLIINRWWSLSMNSKCWLLISISFYYLIFSRHRQLLLQHRALGCWLWLLLEITFSFVNGCLISISIHCAVTTILCKL